SPPRRDAGLPGAVPPAEAAGRRAAPPHRPARTGRGRAISEPLQQPFEIIQLVLRPLLLAGAAAQLFQKVAGAAIDILALQHVLVRADRAVARGRAAQRIALAVGTVELAELLPRLAVLRLPVA